MGHVSATILPEHAAVVDNARRAGEIPLRGCPRSGSAAGRGSPVRAGVRRTSGYPVTPGFKSQLSPAHSPTADALGRPRFWEDLLAATAVRLAHRRRRLRVYAELVESGAMAQAARAYGEQRLRLAPPLRRTINRAGGRRKTLFLFEAEEEL